MREKIPCTKVFHIIFFVPGYSHIYTMWMFVYEIEHGGNAAWHSIGRASVFDTEFLARQHNTTRKYETGPTTVQVGAIFYEGTYSSKQDQISLVKNSIYIYFCAYCRSYLIFNIPPRNSSALPLQMLLGGRASVPLPRGSNTYHSNAVTSHQCRGNGDTLTT